jgi:pimeloyl-ACP methyl ester carboxylesterase
MHHSSLHSPRLHHLPCTNPQGTHRMAYWEWGDSHNPNVVVCVHGLTRQGRDFDTLAQDLAPHCRVICPDVVGRGQSDWLPDPAGYGIPTYAADMLALVAHLGAPQIDWVGTSMGGLIGLVVASLPQQLVRRLVINDVGPTLQAAALQRIGSFLGVPVHWPSEQAAADAMWAVSTGFGPHTPEQWLALSRPQIKPDGTGFTRRSDPGIAVPFKAVTPELAAAGEAALWHAYDQLRCPTLLLRGALSDLLSPATAAAMTQRGPKAQLVEFAGVGHAPTLVQPEQRAAVLRFLTPP